MITLPNCPPIQTQTLKLVSFSIDQTPQLGGPQIRVSRLGDRWAADVVTWPANYAEESRIMLSRLVRGLTDTVLMRVLEPGMRDLPFGTPQIAAAGAFGSTVPVKGLGAGRVVPEGKFLSIVSGGQRFLYQVTAQVTSDGSGNATLPIYPMLRRQPALNDVVELSQPKMEGFVQGNEYSWEVASKSRYVGFQFSIQERE